jgi:tetratricopeptide (TPR) repeat protein
MTKSLGERIKELRKELKMTQTDLAGSEMTKSMLSQIENNLAMPSMKNLQYLASRLGKSVSYFLDDTDYQGSLPMEEIHEELRKATQLVRSRKYEEALSGLESMLSKYSFDRSSKLYADFLLINAKCLIALNHYEDGKEKINETVAIYKNKFLFIDAAKAQIELIDIPWSAYDYKKCMDILEEALFIYSSSIAKDYAFEIETLYIRSVLSTGLDNLDDALSAINKALSISKETNIYYKSDELYKNLAAINMFMGNTEHFDEYTEKARQFSVFTENNFILASIEGICALRLNQLNKPEDALEHLNKAEQLAESIAPFINTEKAKSYYLLQDYQRVVDIVREIEYQANTLFRLDYLHICGAKIFEGLSLNKLGRRKEAITAIKQGIERMEEVKESKALVFAYKCLSEVYSDTGDYEKAFAALRKANEIDELTKDSNIYY